MTDPSPQPPDAVAPLVSVVVVNYQSWPDVVRLVGSLAGEPEVEAGRVEVVIIDNDSGEPVPDPLRESLPNGVQLQLQHDNGGFSAGVNAGRSVARGRCLLVLNPDVVPDPGWMAAVVRRVETDLSGPGRPAGVVGFGLRNPDGSRQPSVGVFPGLLRTAWEQLIPRVRRKYQPDWRVQPGPVDWVTGACMLLSVAMLDDVGGMDPEFFLYHEEVALCRAATDRGWRVEYDPSISVVHLRPLQNRPISPKMRVITRHSKLLYFRKHRPHWQFRILQAVVSVEAKARGWWTWTRGREVEAKSWAAVAEVSRRLGRGEPLGGTAVRDLGNQVEAPT